MDTEQRIGKRTRRFAPLARKQDETAGKPFTETEERV